MEKEKLPPIPTPASQRWREFRIRVLPFLVFFVVLSGVVSLWKNFVQPVGIVGLAETNAVNIVSTIDGLLGNLNVQRFQMVTQGQVLGTIENVETRLFQAEVAVDQADLEVLRERLMVDRQRTVQSYQQFRQDLFNHRVAQATDQVNWVVASNNFRRASDEFKQKLTSESVFELAQGQLEALTATLRERGRQIEDLTKTLEDLNKQTDSSKVDAITAAVEAKRKELEVLLMPIVLTAPINGMISQIHHFSGERVLRGMPIVTISDPVANHVIAYLRQPISVRPTTNDHVQITTRGLPRRMGAARILQVGAQLEPLNPALLSAEAKRIEVGLPILVTVPTDMVLLPGEFVDLAIKRTAHKN